MSLEESVRSAFHRGEVRGAEGPLAHAGRTSTVTLKCPRQRPTAIHTYHFPDPDSATALIDTQIGFGRRARQALIDLVDDLTPELPDGVPGISRLRDDLAFAVQMHGAAHLLLEQQLQPERMETNMAEPAAALVRQLFEIYLEIAWIYSTPVPDGLGLPTDFGDPYALADAVASDWPEEEARFHAAAIVALANTWIDFQALRCEREDNDEQRKLRTLQYGADDATVSLIRAKDEMVRLRLEEVGAPTSKPPALVDRAAAIDTEFHEFYRISSSQLHFRMVARNYQFGPSTAGRRLWLAARSNAILLDAARTVLMAATGDASDLDDLTEGPNGFRAIIRLTPEEARKLLFDVEDFPITE